MIRRSKTKLTDYEPKRRNPITLGDDSNIDKDLKVIRVDSKNSILELSENELKVRGTIDASAITVDGASVQTGTDAGATQLNELSDVAYSSGDLTVDSLDKIIVGYFTIDSSNDIELDAEGGQIWIANAGTTFGQFDTASASKLKLIGTTNYQVELHSQVTVDISLNSADNITLDAADTLVIDTDGTFIMKRDGTEFSVANSAYAGMIVGYSIFRNNGTSSGEDAITIGTSFTVLETDHGNKVNVSFVAPPSGSVEIIFSAMVYGSSKTIYFALSDNATYNEINKIYTYDANCIKTDETDRDIAYVSFPVTGLTAGTSYQYWIGAKSSGASSYIYQGANRFDSHSPPISVKVIALPGTITTGE